MNDSLYRGEINALYSGLLIIYYSDVGRLNVGKASAVSTLTVRGYSDGYVIDYWIVNGERYTWESGDMYADNVLSITDIEENYTVVVFFTESTAKYTVNTSVYSEDGVPAAELASGGIYGAYIPVDFALTLNSDYYVVEWSDTVTAYDTLKNANLEVDVVIAEKPVVTVNAADNGSIVALGTNADASSFLYSVKAIMDYFLKIYDIIIKNSIKLFVILDYLGF